MFLCANYAETAEVVMLWNCPCLFSGKLRAQQHWCLLCNSTDSQHWFTCGHILTNPVNRCIEMSSSMILVMADSIHSTHALFEIKHSAKGASAAHKWFTKHVELLDSHKACLQDIIVIVSTIIYDVNQIKTKTAHSLRYLYSTLVCANCKSFVMYINEHSYICKHHTSMVMIIVNPSYGEGEFGGTLPSHRMW